MMADSAAFVREVDVSRETLERLEVYADLLRRWTARINLVSKSTLDHIWERHFLDSAQLLPLAPAVARRWTDLGSGGGFPGLVIAILAAEMHPDLRVTLIESDRRKAEFLRTVGRETSTSVEVVAGRAEEVPGTTADVVSARALAPLKALLPLVERHLAPGGIALLPKGAGHRQERDEALETWAFDCENIPSRTDPGAVILKVGDIRRV